MYALVVSRELGRISIVFYIGSIKRLFCILVLKVGQCAVVEARLKERSRAADAVMM